MEEGWAGRQQISQWSWLHTTAAVAIVSGCLFSRVVMMLDLSIRVPAPVFSMLLFFTRSRTGGISGALCVWSVTMCVHFHHYIYYLNYMQYWRCYNNTVVLWDGVDFCWSIFLMWIKYYLYTDAKLSANTFVLCLCFSKLTIKQLDVPFQNCVLVSPTQIFLECCCIRNTN